MPMLMMRGHFFFFVFPKPAGVRFSLARVEVKARWGRDWCRGRFPPSWRPNLNADLELVATSRVPKQDGRARSFGNVVRAGRVDEPCF